VTVLSIETME